LTRPNLAIIKGYTELRKNTDSERKKHTERLNKLDDQVMKAREFLLAGDIEISDFNSIKTEYAKKTAALSTQLIAIEELADVKINIENLTQSVIKTLCALPRLYKTGNFSAKRHIITTIFPDVLIYNGDSYRTTKMNEAASVTHLINKELQGNKKGEKALQKNLFPSEGCLSVRITSKFVADLKWLADFPERLKEFNEMGKGYNA
jgi:hypothetical protein